MGPLALLGLAGGIGGLASLMKKKGIDLKKKNIAKEIVKKKKKKYVPEWQTKPDKKKLEEQGAVGPGDAGKAREVLIDGF